MEVASCCPWELHTKYCFEEADGFRSVIYLIIAVSINTEMEADNEKIR